MADYARGMQIQPIISALSLPVAFLPQIRRLGTGTCFATCLGLHYNLNNSRNALSFHTASRCNQPLLGSALRQATRPIQFVNIRSQGMHRAPSRQCWASETWPRLGYRDFGRYSGELGRTENYLSRQGSCHSSNRLCFVQLGGRHHHGSQLSSHYGGFGVILFSGFVLRWGAPMKTSGC